MSEEAFRLGLATASQLLLRDDFSPELGEAIRRDEGPGRAIRALNHEFFPSAPDDPLPEGSIILPKLVRVDRAKPFADMICEARLDNQRDAIKALPEERFPVDRSGIIQGRLVYEKELILLAPYKEGITTRQWWDWMDAHELQREEGPELMATARDFPDCQRKFYIWAFGSSWLSSDGDLRCPVLRSNGGSREAGTHWYGSSSQWSLHYRALVSRKRR